MNRLITLLLTLALVVPVYIYANANADVNITINDEIDSHLTADITIKERLYRDISEQVSFKVKETTDAGIDEVLKRKAHGYGIQDSRGTPIDKDGLDINKEHDLILGFSGGSTDIINAQALPDGRLQVTGSFKQGGLFYSPPVHALAVRQLSTGQPLCFDNTEDERKLAFTVMLDTSGSMHKVNQEVKSLTTQFLKSLPASAQCSVATFNHGFQYSHHHFQSCQTGQFGYEGVQASGGTDAYPVLKAAYQSLSLPYFRDYQTITLLLTDGYTSINEVQKNELLALKGKTMSFAYLIGGNERNALKGVTDSFLPQNGNIKDSLEQYFKVLRDGYTRQKTLIVKACSARTQGNTHAKP